MKTTFVHITDLHVSAPELMDSKLRSDTTTTVRKVLGMIRQIEPRPAFVIASGDLTNHGDAASFRALAGMMEGFDIPVVWALGNHDTREGFYAGLLGSTDSADQTYDHHQVIDGIHLITLDTSNPLRIGGHLVEAQFNFLEAALDAHPDLPKILVMHHAPALDQDPDWEWEGLSFAATDRLAEMLKGRQIAGIFSGHIHQDRFTHWHGIPLIVGMGLHAALDPLHPMVDSIRSVQGTSFSLCTLRDSGLTVTCAPLPSDRRELGISTIEQLQAYEAARAAQFAA
ncbi:metallophosphoesterase [Pararhodobacter zhoushanensis]|uniref:metallophosphoesterase n=1 Tax=Pararhodobacter zhoushanensis TaxID=2479545 RepID=UPI000F8F5DA2|nr:metallophosphoesterase [Pararhodobacter zhoushanensis]